MGGNGGEYIATVKCVAKRGEPEARVGEGDRLKLGEGLLDYIA